MSGPGLASLNHIAITVTNLEVSIPWYEQVFGIGFQMEYEHEGGIGKILADPTWHLVIVLHRHDANEGERFSEVRTGLDHVGFSVADRAELEAWQRHLQSLDVVQSPIADTPYGSFLVFRDPDNVQLELCALPSMPPQS
jgi:glyoxylase I family protein